MKKRLKVDFHCHTSSSKDSTIRLTDLLAECDRKGVFKIAITDHNQVHAALEAASRWPDRIIPGVEIMTNHGELLAYYIKRDIPEGLSPEDTIQDLKDQGCLISVSHPFDRWRNGGWKPERLQELVPRLDAIEVFNAHCISNGPNRIAYAFAQEYQLSGTAGSDAHALREAGTAGLILPDFHDANSLRESLRSAKVFGKRTALSHRLSNRVSRYFSRYR